MKKFLILSLCICLTSLACDKEKNGTPKSGNDYYMFSITIDGVTHKVEGIYSNYYPLSNSCLASGTSIAGSLSDKSAASYISGEVFSFQLNFPNLSLGPNDANCLQANQANNLNWPESGCSDGGPNVFTLYDNGVNMVLQLNLDNVIVTDLGSAGTSNPGNISNPYNWGDPVIGSFSGTVYGCSTNSFPDVYDVPVQLDIEFVAPRLYY